MSDDTPKPIWQPAYGPDDASWHTERVLHEGYLTLETGVCTYKRFDGRTVHATGRELARRPEVVGVLPYDPKTQEVVLLEQVRMGCLDTESPWLLEIVGGTVDPGESIAQAAHRELKEETGLEAIDLQWMIDYRPAPGVNTEFVHVHLATVDAATMSAQAGREDEHEDILCHRFALADAFAMVNDGVINNAISVIALQRFALMQYQAKEDTHAQ